MTTRNEQREQEAHQMMIAHMLGEETIEAAARAVVGGFTMKILRQMQHSDMGLDAAIVEVRGFIFRELHDRPLDTELGETAQIRQEVGELFEAALDDAAEHMKERVQAARDLLALADR